MADSPSEGIVPPAWPGSSSHRERAASVAVSTERPFPQRRITVFFRGLLVIPHVAALWVTSIAAGFVAMAGWFYALGTGRLPGFAASFLTGYTRWAVRVLAYQLLLTDHYPEFGFADDPADPVRLWLAPGPLTRISVFFRFLLAIPAGALAMLALVGAGIAGFAGWLIALLAGELPPALHQANASVSQYLARYLAYCYLLTSEYPAGLFRDMPAGRKGARAPGARVLTGLFVALGCIPCLLVLAILVFLVPALARAFVSGLSAPALPSTSAASSLNSDYSELSSELSQWSSESKTCLGMFGETRVKCLAVTGASGSGAYSNFADDIASLAMPADAAGKAAQLQADAERCSSDAAAITKSLMFSTSGSAPVGTEAKYRQDSTGFERDFAALQQALGSSSGG